MKVNGEYTWDLSQPATLVDLDLTIESGAFVAVVGPTGEDMRIVLLVLPLAP